MNTGSLRVSPDLAKAIALGADAVAVGTAASMAIGCQQYRICHTGNCPVGITSQNPELRARLDVDQSAERLENYLWVTSEKLKDFARLTGNSDANGFFVVDLCTLISEISSHTDIKRVKPSLSFAGR
jgi:glutamate synthase domain-containing protein 2